MNQFPKNFKVVTTFGLILGIFGAFAGISGGLSLVTGADEYTKALSIQQTDPKLQEAQETMMLRVAEIGERYRIPSGLIAIGNMAISVFMIIGAVGTAKLRRNSRRVFVKTLALSIPFDVLAGIAGMIIAYQTTKVTQELMSSAMSTAPGMSNDAAQITSTVMGATIYLTLIYGVVWLGLKIWYYVWARNRLLKPDVDELFAQYGV
jgi:hypothetical protein